MFREQKEDYKQVDLRQIDLFQSHNRDVHQNILMALKRPTMRNERSILS
jgi:hypothetical protein